MEIHLSGLVPAGSGDLNADYGLLDWDWAHGGGQGTGYRIHDLRNPSLPAW